MYALLSGYGPSVTVPSVATTLTSVGMQPAAEHPQSGVHGLLNHRVGSLGPSGWFPPRGLLGVALSHLALVCGKRSQNLPFLLLGHVEVVERSPKLSRDLVEDGGRDLQRPMGFFQAERSTARFAPA